MSTAQDQTSQNRPGEGGQEQNPGQGGNEQDVMDVPADVQVGKSFAKALQLFFDPLRCDTVFGYLLDIYFVKHYLVVIGLRS